MRMRPLRERIASESGLTFVELLITVVILTMITGAIAMSFVNALSATRSSRSQIAQSNDAQLISSFLVRDAQAAGGINPATTTGYANLAGFFIGTPANTPTPGIFVTGAPNNACNVSGTPIVRFDWNDRAAPTTTTALFTQPATNANVTVSLVTTSNMTVGGSLFIETGGMYRIVSTSGGNSAVLKNLGFAGNAPAGSQIANASQAVPIDGHIVVYSTSSQQLIRTSCTDGNAASVVTLGRHVASASVSCNPGGTTCPTNPPDTISLTVQPASQPNIPAGAPFTLTANVRIGNEPALAVANATPAPLLLLGDSSCAPDPAATGLSVAYSAHLRVYGQTYINSPDAGCGKAMSLLEDPFSGFFGNQTTYQAGGTNILAGGSCTSSGNTTGCPAAPNYSPALADPFAGLTPPDPASMPAINANSQCQGANGTANPGYYAQQLSIFFQNCTLKSGVYYLQQGLSLAVIASLKMEAGGTGVLLYIAGGSFNAVLGTSIALSGMSSGPYKGLAIWQALSDKAQMQLGLSGTFNIDGTLYAPSAEINNSVGSSNTVTELVAKSLLVSGIPLLGALATSTTTIGTGPVTPLSITNPAVPPGIPSWDVGQPYPITPVAATGGALPYTWSMSGQPPGLVIDPTTGVISGTPTITGSYTATVHVTDPLGDIFDQPYNLTIGPAPAISTNAIPDWTLNVGYSFTMHASGGTAPFTWGASNLPPGLTIDTSSGTISGSPTAAGTYTPTITLKDTPGAVAPPRTYTMHINDVPKINGPATLPAWTVSTAYAPPSPTAQIVVANGTGPITWTVSGQPGGMGISSSGVLNGTPNAAGTYSVTVTALDAAGALATKTYSVANGNPLIINPPPGIAATPLPQGEIGRLYNAIPITNPGGGYAVPVAGGTPPYTWTTTGTNLPAGLSINAAGVIAGTPTGSPSAPTVTLKVKDSAGSTTTKTFTLTVVANPSINAPNTLKSWTVGQDYQGVQVTETGGIAPFTWLASGLPHGLAMDATGNITGTPDTAGTSNVTVTLTDVTGYQATKTYNNVVINPTPSVATSSLPGGEQNLAYNSGQMTASGGTPNFTWTANGLPTGLSMSSGGVISGSTNSIGTFPISIVGKDAAGVSTLPANLSLAIGPAPAIIGTLPNGELTVPYATALSANGTGPFTWSATGLPGGLSIGSTTGAITGTPNATGTFSNVKITVTDSLNGTATTTYTIVVAAGPSITSTSPLPGAPINVPYSVTLTESGGIAPLTWSATPATLPVGLSISSAGVISGTPTAPGTSAVAVTLTDAKGATANKTLSITVGTPATVTSVSPLSRGQGAQNQNITITGTGFVNAPGAPVAAFSNAGVTVNSTSFVSPTTLTANIKISGSATIGAGTVTVMNGDTLPATGSGVFTVNAGPTITTVNPTSHSCLFGCSSFAVTITGTGFVNGSTTVALIATSGTAPTITSTTWTGTTQIKILINIPAFSTSTENVVVTNPDGGQAIAVAGFKT